MLLLKSMYQLLWQPQNFIKKAANNEQFQNWFCLNDDPVPNFKTRSDKVSDRNPVKARTERYANSPLPYLTDVLNKLMNKK